MNIQTVKQDCAIAQLVAKELNAQGFRASYWQKGDKSPRVYVKGSGGCNGYLEIEDLKVHGNLTGYGRSGEAGNIADAICKAHQTKVENDQEKQVSYLVPRRR